MSFIAETQLFLPADPGFREARDREARFGRLRHGAIIAAALVHAAVIAAFLLRWPFSGTPALPEQPPIPVALVTEVPQPKLAAKPPAPPLLHELRSGPDQKTTAPPQAEAKGPQAAPQPEPDRDKPAALGLAKPEPDQPAAPKPPNTTKQATRETAPEPRKRGSVDRAPGETEAEGDPYLNRVWSMIERHRSYPANAIGSLGLRLEGTVVYLIAVSPTGALRAIRLERSSGAAVLDDTARRMIERAAPFPPLPSYFPHGGTTLSVTIHIFPTAS
jgi:periplasmic protein TonB